MESSGKHAGKRRAEPAPQTPASKGGETLTGLLTHPEKRVEEDLYNFKTYVEGRKATV